MVGKAKEIIKDELRRALQADVMSKFIGPQLRQMIVVHRENPDWLLGAGAEKQSDIMRQQGQGHGFNLVGLSFKKQRKEKTEPIQEIVVEEEEELEVEKPPKKKRKKEEKETTSKKKKKLAGKKHSEVDVESEDEDAVHIAAKKRPLSAVESESEAETVADDEPVRKRSKVTITDSEALIKRKKKKELKKKKAILEHEEDLVEGEEDELSTSFVPTTRLSPGIDSSLSPSRSVSPFHRDRSLSSPPRTPTPPPNPAEGVCEDDEDQYYAKLVLSGRVPSDENSNNNSNGVQKDSSSFLSSSAQPSEESGGINGIRKHVTGSARTEGFYKITHAEKATYVTQYQARAATTSDAAADTTQDLSSSTVVPIEDTAKPIAVSSRSNRANARRRAQGLEEINQVQRAVALSKGETGTGNELSFKFNQLQTRKKHLRFARSPIHDWGLYAMERIARGEMVIEYVGEVIRAQVAEKREKTYERQGIGSSYLFRIDEDLVVDATKKGNLG